MLASDFGEVSVSQIILSVERIACQKDYHLFFASGAEFDYNVKDALAFLTRRSLDGLIILFGVTSDSPVGEIEGVDIPLVSINRPVSEGHPCIMPDNRDGGYRAAEHLIEIGCDRLALITGPVTRFASQERVRGFRQGIEDRGESLSEERVYKGDFEYESGREGALRLMELDPGIDGLFCANDMMAAGAINAATEIGISIPDRLKVIGFDDRNLASIWPIPFTSFTAPFEEMGRASAALLLAMIEGREQDTGMVYIKSSLVPRRSTGH